MGLGLGIAMFESAVRFDCVVRLSNIPRMVSMRRVSRGELLVPEGERRDSP